MFSCKICKVFKNTYFEEHMWTAASAVYLKYVLLFFCRMIFWKFRKTHRKITGWHSFVEYSFCFHLKYVFFWSCNGWTIFGSYRLWRKYDVRGRDEDALWDTPSIILQILIRLIQNLTSYDVNSISCLHEILDSSGKSSLIC